MPAVALALLVPIAVAIVIAAAVFLLTGVVAGWAVWLVVGWWVFGHRSRRVPPRAGGSTGPASSARRRRPGRGIARTCRQPFSPSSSTARNASWGTSIRPTCFIRCLPRFCCSSSLRLRVMSPP